MVWYLEGLMNNLDDRRRWEPRYRAVITGGRRHAAAARLGGLLH